MNRPNSKSPLRILRRYPAAVIFGCVALLLAAIDGLAYKHLRLLGEARALRQRDGEELSALLVRGSALRDESDAVTGATRRIEENLVTETNLAENLWYFYKIEEDTRARLTELRQLTAPLADTDSPYRTIPYSIKLTGTYEQVSAFLYRLETGPRLSRITSFNFSRMSPSNPSVSLDLSLSLLGRP